MTRLLSRTPTEADERAYEEWAAKYFGYACDNCGETVPEAEPHVHDVEGKPREVYCSPHCYHEHQRTQQFLAGEVTESWLAEVY